MKRFNVFIAMIIFASLACSLPVTAPSEEVVATATIAPVDTATRTFTPGPTNTPTYTPTLVQITQRVPSETPTLTDTPLGATNTAGPTPTLTPFLVELTVSRPTNCRTGPGKEYDVVGSLVPGVTVPVIGRDGTSQYWYIPNPYVFTDYCWVTGEYATLTGPQFLVPLVEKGGTPTPTSTLTPFIDFTVKLGGKQTCDGSHWLNFNIANTGKTFLQSVSIVMTDKTKNTTRSTTTDNFPLLISCNPMSFDDQISLSDSDVRVSGPKFDYNFQNNKISITMKICAADGLQEPCATKTINLNQ